MESLVLYPLLILTLAILPQSNGDIPFVITTWGKNGFELATDEAWRVVQDSSALDAIESGCSVCEWTRCDGTVGYGGSPDEDGETVLDAMIMDGNNMNVGAVASMRRIKSAISVARKVLDHTSHSILAGDLATKFAKGLGFKEQPLSTDGSLKMWEDWKKGNCQPNYWTNVNPDPRQNCGPYTLNDNTPKKEKSNSHRGIGIGNHDTIGMVVIDKKGHIAAGTSTNGMKFKIPGRVGDSPIPGSGAYADSEIGGAAATGDGDVMLRFSPSLLTVEGMRRGLSPKAASEEAVARMTKFYPNFSGAVVAVNGRGEYGAACNGMKEFPFAIASSATGGVKELTVPCSHPSVIQI